MSFTSQLVDCGWAGQALDLESGDLHLVAPFPGGVLVALIDGLGHGPEAAAAAAAAVSLLEQRPGDAVDDLLRLCHRGLRKTRGVAMSLTSFTSQDRALMWGGVGNVDSVLLRSGSTEPYAGIPLRGGVVGYQLPPLRVETIALAPGDLLVMATDGIRSGFTEHIQPTAAPEEIAKSTLRRWSKGTDDARVVVVRFKGAHA